MKEWKKYKFSDFVEINPTVSLKNGEEYSFIEMKDLNEGNRFVFPSRKRPLTGGARFKEGDTLFARITPCLENGKICQATKLENEIGFGSTEFLIFSERKNISDKNFIFYLSRWDEVRKYAELNLVGTSGRQRVPKDVFDKLELNLPPLSLQTRIAEILSSLDDKIELNRRMNQTLEQMAQALFKKYFVDDIDSENLPKGWRKIPIGDLIDYAIGGDWGKEIIDEKNIVNVTIIRGTDFDAIKKSNFNKLPKRFIKNENFTRRELKDGDIVFEISGGSTDQPTGRNFRISNSIINELGNKVVPASFCRLIRPKSMEIGYFLSLYLMNLYEEGGTWEYQNQSTGISNFQYTYFTEKEYIVFPNDPASINTFAKRVKPLFALIDENIKEVNKLLKTRDSLLPKLFSGEIDVENVIIPQAYEPELSC